MVSYEYKGVVEVIGETKAFGTNGFTKRDVVLGNPPDVPSNYPNPVLFTFKKDRCALLDAVKVGDLVKIQFTIDGRRWEGPNGIRYFTDLTGWKIEQLNADGSSVEAMSYGSACPAPAPANAGSPASAPQPPAAADGEEFIDDDVPF